jgi:hypothetical protein
MKLVLLPDRSEIFNPYTLDESMEDERIAFREGVNTVYTQAKDLGIDTLAEEWCIQESSSNYLKPPKPQKFSDFIKEMK